MHTGVGIGAAFGENRHSMKATYIGAHLPDICCEGRCDLQAASVHLLRRSISIDLQHNVVSLTTL